MKSDHDGCDCIPCRARRAGVGPPPWTPDQWALIDPAPAVVDDPVKTDPAVIEAEAARDAAREVFDVAEALWLRVTAAKARADLRGHVGGNKAYVSYGNGLGRLKTPAEMAEETRLADELAEAEERRADAWARVVKANAAIAKAQHAVRVRLAVAEARAA